MEQFGYYYMEEDGELLQLEGYDFAESFDQDYDTGVITSAVEGNTLQVLEQSCIRK